MKFTRCLLALTAATSSVLALPAGGPAQEDLVTRDEVVPPAVAAVPASVDVAVPSDVPTPAAEVVAPTASPSNAPISTVDTTSSSTAGPVESLAPSSTETTPTSSAPEPSASVFELNGEIGTVVQNEDGWLVYQPMDRNSIEARAIADVFDLFPEVPLIPEASASAAVDGESDDGFTLSNAERIKRGLKPRRPAKLWSGRAPQQRPAGLLRARDPQLSAIKCANSGTVEKTCNKGQSNQSKCTLANADCTQLQTPAADPDQGAKSCFSMCPSGSCAGAAYTQDGECLVFTQNCCPTNP